MQQPTQLTPNWRVTNCYASWCSTFKMHQNTYGRWQSKSVNSLPICSNWHLTHFNTTSWRLSNKSKALPTQVKSIIKDSGLVFAWVGYPENATKYYGPIRTTIRLFWLTLDCSSDCLGFVCLLKHLWVNFALRTAHTLHSPEERKYHNFHKDEFLN